MNPAMYRVKYRAKDFNMASKVSQARLVRKSKRVPVELSKDIKGIRNSLRRKS